MGESEITITYETLYELLRREKTKEDIQKLDENFIESVKDYLSEKRSMLFKNNDQQMLFSEEEQQKTLKQISNIIKVIRELYDRREKKVIRLAINMSKTNSSAIDTSRLLAEEKDMFIMLVDVLNIHRAKILCSIIDESRAKDILSKVNGEIPVGDTKKKLENIRQNTPKVTEKEPSNNQEPIETTQQSQPDKKEPAQNMQDASKENINVKFLTDVQKFIDPQLKVHGPFSSNDTATLPISIADVLIKKGKAEAI